MAGRILIFAAALLGAAGVILLALAAHKAPGSGLEGAGSLLLFHAAAVIAAVAALHQGLLRRGVALVAATALLLGASLFAADIGVRALADQRLFPMAAPSGGTLMIAGWLLLATAALPRRAR